MDPKSVSPEMTTQDAISSTVNEMQEIEAELASLLNGDSNQLGGADVAELLKRLTDANIVAESMESKLDSVLQNLDGLLSTLDSIGKDDGDASNNGTSSEQAQLNTTNINVSGNAS